MRLALRLSSSCRFKAFHKNSRPVLQTINGSAAELVLNFNCLITSPKQDARCGKKGLKGNVWPKGACRG